MRGGEYICIIFPFYIKENYGSKRWSDCSSLNLENSKLCILSCMSLKKICPFQTSPPSTSNHAILKRSWRNNTFSLQITKGRHQNQLPSEKRFLRIMGPLPNHLQRVMLEVSLSLLSLFSGAHWHLLSSSFLRFCWSPGHRRSESLFPGPCAFFHRLSPGHIRHTIIQI